MLKEPTVRYHESKHHHGITYISYQYESSIIIKDAQSDELLLQTFGAGIDYIEFEKLHNVHDLAEVAKIASDLTKER